MTFRAISQSLPYHQKYVFLLKLLFIVFPKHFQPNTYSPANVDASVAFRNWKEGKDNKYKEIIAKQVDLNLNLKLRK